MELREENPTLTEKRDQSHDRAKHRSVNFMENSVAYVVLN
jgi:hypothetical protein